MLKLTTTLHKTSFVFMSSSNSSWRENTILKSPITTIQCNSSDILLLSSFKWRYKSSLNRKYTFIRFMIVPRRAGAYYKTRILPFFFCFFIHRHKRCRTKRPLTDTWKITYFVSGWFWLIKRKLRGLFSEERIHRKRVTAMLPWKNPDKIKWRQNRKSPF